MGEAAIYVAPARYEPFGLAILEAAAGGCALVLGQPAEPGRAVGRCGALRAARRHACPAADAARLDRRSRGSGPPAGGSPAPCPRLLAVGRMAGAVSGPLRAGYGPMRAQGTARHEGGPVLPFAGLLLEPRQRAFPARRRAGADRPRPRGSGRSSRPTAGAGPISSAEHGMRGLDSWRWRLSGAAHRHLCRPPRPRCHAGWRRPRAGSRMERARSGRGARPTACPGRAFRAPVPRHASSRRHGIGCVRKRAPRGLRRRARFRRVPARALSRRRLGEPGLGLARGRRHLAVPPGPRRRARARPGLDRQLGRWRARRRAAPSS